MWVRQDECVGSIGKMVYKDDVYVKDAVAKCVVGIAMRAIGGKGVFDTLCEFQNLLGVEQVGCAD